MHCYHCGSQIPDGLKFCVDCGAELDEPVSEVRPLVEKKLPEAPEVEQLTDASSGSGLFVEELAQETAEELPAEEAAEEAEEAAEEAEETEELEEEAADPALDPTSDQFDPRKFAEQGMEEFAPAAPADDEEEPEEEKPSKAKKAPKKNKKKGKGGIVALILVLAALLLGGAAGLLYWLTEPVDQAQLRGDFAGYMSYAEDTAVEAFNVTDRETSRLNRSDAIWCTVTAADDAVRTQRTYVMQYALTREGWKLRSVEDISTETWTAQPLVGASLEEIYAALTGQVVTVDSDFLYPLEAEDAQTAEIMSQSPDLNAKTDTVEAVISVTDDLVGWTADVDLTLTFTDHWKLDTFSYDNVQMEFKPGMEFKLEEEDFAEDMAQFPIVLGEQESEDTVETTTVVDGEEVQEAPDMTVQTVKVLAEQVQDLTVTEKRFSLAEDTQNVTCEFVLDKPAAKLQVTAVLSYVFEDGWKLDAAEYEAVVEEIKLEGDWAGTYTAVEGQKPNVKLTVKTDEEGKTTNTFAFSAPEGVWYPTGSYYVASATDAETLNVKFDPTEWTPMGNPGNITMVGIDGTLMIEEGTITDGETFSITLQVPVEVTEETQE
ncbi:MAG: zinc ribbon domain-containing protein [Oscillospiraceae bacterium]|nr:zinc ribbon domain-containing protein [Oscillospiraceae bacterium]